MVGSMCRMGWTEVGSSKWHVLYNSSVQQDSEVRSGMQVVVLKWEENGG